MFEQLPVETAVQLAPFTTFKIGGPAKYFLRVNSKEQLITAVQEAKDNAVPVFFLGGGSDILIHDNGFPGLVIKIEMNAIEISNTTVRAEAGALINAVIGRAIREGLSGLEFATGVPATIGGAVWANLGSRGSEISKVLTSVTVLTSDLQERVLTNEECAFGYRESIFKHEPYTIIDATFELAPGDKVELRKRMVELTKQKKAEQNVGEDTAGCAFRNPSDSDITSAKLIDDLGLKGYQIGGAQVSNRHANFIINTGNATADDVVQLISYIKQQVRDKAGVQLMEEIEYVGF